MNASYAADLQHLPTGNDFSRYLMSRTGSFWLGRPGDSRKVPLKTQKISAEEIIFTSPVQLERGNVITLEISEFGRYTCRVTRVIGGSTRVELLVDVATRADLAGKVSWLERRRVLELPEKRRFRRWVPKQRRSTVLYHSGLLLQCWIKDVSCSGAAVLIDFPPAEGEVVALGKIVGSVARAIEGGFGLKFSGGPLPPDVVEAKICPMRPRPAATDIVML
jgi:hypothetical protein